MKSFRLRLMIFLFICTTLFVVSSSATNFYERHGNNFIYLESIGEIQFDTLTYAPMIWDLRAGTIDLRDYYVSYGWDSTDVYDSTYNAIDLLMAEAWNHGINFANARGEIMRMTLGQLSEPDSSDFFVNVAEIVREDSLHLIAGGFFTDTSSYSESHNDSVITYLAEYCSLTVGPGKFIGVFGFDEPDARYEGPSWSHSEHNTDWYYLVEEYA